VAWALLALVSDAVQLWFSLHVRNNHWMDYLFPPLSVALLLSALALWHERPVLRLMYRVAILVFGLLWAGLVLYVEDLHSFSLVGGPLNALVLLLASLGVLIIRLRSTEESLMRADWFWISVGVAMRFGSDAALQPFALLYTQRYPSLVYSALQVKAGVDVIASLLIARGILCPLPPRPSGGSSSPVASPSPSWSSPSASPW
jgi:hypothetical protein